MNRSRISRVRTFVFQGAGGARQGQYQAVFILKELMVLGGFEDFLQERWLFRRTKLTLFLCECIT